MTFIISNENEKLKLGTIPSVRICQNMLEMALRCHHFAYKFHKFPGGGPPDPPNGRGDTPLPYQPPSRATRSGGVLRTPSSFLRTPPCWNLRTGYYMLKRDLILIARVWRPLIIRSVNSDIVCARPSPPPPPTPPPPPPSYNATLVSVQPSHKLYRIIHVL